MAAKIGRACKVTLGATKTLGLGTWAITGLDADMHEDTEFGDSVKTYKVGLREGGTVAFSGYCDPADSTGQTQLETYWLNGTDVTSLQFYVDASSYWTPMTTGPLSHINITGYDISTDKSGLVMISFTGKVSGYMVFV